jgi:hypothetical protein
MRLQDSTPLPLRAQETLAKKQQSQAEQVVIDNLVRLESTYGIPVEIESLAGTDSSGAIPRDFWNQKTRKKCHTIVLGKCEPWLRPHRLAGAVALIEFECQANEAGRRLTHVLSRDAFLHLLNRQTPNGSDNNWVLRTLFAHLRSLPVELLVETNMKRKFPALLPAQIVNVNRFAAQAPADLTDLVSMNVSPQLWVAARALHATRALFVDKTFPCGTTHFDRFKDQAVRSLAEQAYQTIIEFSGSDPKPGDHYGLVDRISELFGLMGLHDWDVRPTFELNELVADHVRSGSAEPFQVMRHSQGPALE